jgi:DNA-binding response OmpR family regulator
VDVHISHLRKKLTARGGSPKLIQTVRGVGYVLGGERE